ERAYGMKTWQPGAALSAPVTTPGAAPVPETISVKAPQEAAEAL
ncbi:MAG: hypothetical protein K0S16_2054, partial [Moraxellaceae bacterium]|nr:hypothetical protein [Moraxellaceae bacterium]